MLSSLGFGSRGRAAKTSKGLSVFFSNGPTAASNPQTVTAKFELGYNRYADPLQSSKEFPLNSTGPLNNNIHEGRQIKPSNAYGIYQNANAEDYNYQRPLPPKLDISESADSLRCESGSVIDLRIPAGAGTYVPIPIDVTDTLSDSTASPPSPRPPLPSRTASAPTQKPTSTLPIAAPQPIRVPSSGISPPPRPLGSYNSHSAVASRDISPNRGRDATNAGRPSLAASYTFPSVGEVDDRQYPRSNSIPAPRPRTHSKDPVAPRRESEDRQPPRLTRDRVSPTRQGSYGEGQHQSHQTLTLSSTTRKRVDSLEYGARHYHHEPPGLGTSASSSSKYPVQYQDDLGVGPPMPSDPAPTRVRRNSDVRDARKIDIHIDTQALSSLRQNSANTVQTGRNVRWDENLICPSPILPSQRRQGWYNRRGDQLWTNNGKFRSPSTEKEYPADLDGYPEAGQGWMNEHGVRIDMQHRLVPKVPARSALKRTTV